MCRCQEKFIMHFTFNLAFMTFTQDILNLSSHIPITNTMTLQYFNFSLFEFKGLQGKKLFHQPQMLVKHRQCLLNDTSLSPSLSKRGLMNNPQNTIMNALPFKIINFCLAIIGCASLIPLVRLCCKHKKLKTFGSKHSSS